MAVPEQKKLGLELAVQHADRHCQKLLKVDVKLLIDFYFDFSSFFDLDVWSTCVAVVLGFIVSAKLTDYK